MELVNRISNENPINYNHHFIHLNDNFMSHPAQRTFCKAVKDLYPEHFNRVNVIDVGSLHINGNNRGYFPNSNYIGVDIFKGRNVDIVGRAHLILPGIKIKNDRPAWNPFFKRIEMPGKVDTIISTEALEHDETWRETLGAIYNKVRPGGLILITCAGDGRAEHGTSKERPQDSPGTNDYYMNVSNEMFCSMYPNKPSFFKEYFLRQHNTDLQFFGIKA